MLDLCCLFPSKVHCLLLSGTTQCFKLPGSFRATYDDTILKLSSHEDGLGFGLIGFHALSQIFYGIEKLIPGATP